MPRAGARGQGRPGYHRIVTFPAASPRPRRPIFGWIALALVIAGYLTLAGAAAWANQQTQDAFIQQPPWWALTSSVAALPVGVLAGLALLLGVIGTVRREKPGWPTITAMILSLPLFGYLAAAAYVWLTVAAACAGPAGACG
jgi:energy-converting hydrogenase Eha subunit C